MKQLNHQKLHQLKNQIKLNTKSACSSTPSLIELTQQVIKEEPMQNFTGEFISRMKKDLKCAGALGSRDSVMRNQEQEHKQILSQFKVQYLERQKSFEQKQKEEYLKSNTQRIYKRQQTERYLKPSIFQQKEDKSSIKIQDGRNNQLVQQDSQLFKQRDSQLLKQEDTQLPKQNEDQSQKQGNNLSLKQSIIQSLRQGNSSQLKQQRNSSLKIENKIDSNNTFSKQSNDNFKEQLLEQIKPEIFRKYMGRYCHLKIKNVGYLIEPKEDFITNKDLKVDKNLIYVHQMNQQTEQPEEEILNGVNTFEKMIQNQSVEQIQKKLSEQLTKTKQKFNISTTEVEDKFFKAIKENEAIEIQYLLDRYPDLTSSLNEKGESPLTYATKYGSKETISQLLLKGADIYYKNNVSYFNNVNLILNQLNKQNGYKSCELARKLNRSEILEVFERWIERMSKRKLTRNIIFQNYIKKYIVGYFNS